MYSNNIDDIKVLLLIILMFLCETVFLEQYNRSYRLWREQSGSNTTGSKNRFPEWKSVHHIREIKSVEYCEVFWASRRQRRQRWPAEILREDCHLVTEEGTATLPVKQSIYFITAILEERPANKQQNRKRRNKA